MHEAFHLEKTDEGIGILTFDLPKEKVNKFSTPVMEELDELLTKITQMKDLKCLLIRSAKPGIFIAGADIKEIENIDEMEQGFEVSRKGQLIFDKVTNLPYPTIAVIDGACMGGGTEFSLTCTYRLASDNPKTKIGLPEVNLGIIPGWGGTQRLPRLIGLQRSLGIILTGKSLDGKRAFRSGLVDKLIPKELVNETAIEFARAVMRGENVLRRSRRKQKGFMPFLLEKNKIDS
jgi:3-hydroxyacyl-CoA dehydrogenase/enoyl-CoA hydratase/3-hydroxybutyryl-CoA epimerase